MVKVTFECAVIDCELSESVSVTERGELESPVESFMPKGWGFDLLPDGLHSVLHCPEHRGT